ncbi:hypothetical protein B0H13DRAFT_871510 [Mycena leptocephala]|nr:hypothetical protein B0H13DRAFT_871510 [Mycena leptocephala]
MCTHNPHATTGSVTSATSTTSPHSGTSQSSRPSICGNASRTIPRRTASQCRTVSQCTMRGVHRRAADVPRTSEAAGRPLADQSPGARMYGPHVRRPADCTSYSSSGGGAEYHIPGPPVPCADTMYDALWPPARHVTRGSPPQRASNRISPPRAIPIPIRDSRVGARAASVCMSVASTERWGGVARKGGKRKGDEGKMGTVGDDGGV